MVYTSDRPIAVDGVRLDTLAWNIEKVNRAVAARRESDVQVPGRDGVIPSLNDTLEPANLGLEMFVRGTDPDGKNGSRDRLRENLDSLVHLFGTRHRLLDVQDGPRPRRNLAPNPMGVATRDAPVEVRRNLVQNPIFRDPATGAGGWVPYWMGSAWTPEWTAYGALRVTCVDPQTFLWGLANWAPLPAGRADRLYTFAVRVRSTIGAPAFRIIPRFGDGTQEVGADAPFQVVASVASGGWTDLVVTFKAPPWATMAMLLLNMETTPVAGDVIEWAQAAIGEGTAPPRFSGEGAWDDANGLTFSWEGTPHNSQSVAKGQPLAMWTGTDGSTATQGPAISGTPQRIAFRNGLGAGINGGYGAPIAVEAGSYYALRLRVRRIPGETTTGSVVTVLWDGEKHVAKSDQRGTVDTSTLPADGSPVYLHAPAIAPVREGAANVTPYLHGDPFTAVYVDEVIIEKVGGPGGEAGDYFDGYSFPNPSANRITAWEGAAYQSAAIQHDTRTRRAWAKVVDTITPDLNESGSAGRFTVGLEIPSGTWEDPYTRDWEVLQPGWGGQYEVTSLRGATERITDAVIVVHGPCTNPRLTDPTTGAYVQRNGVLQAWESWRINVGTWSSRWGTELTLDSADTDGNDAQAETVFGGTRNQAAFLPLTPTLQPDGTRRVFILPTANGWGEQVSVRIRARRRYAL